jgi:hypothetical protein
MKQNIKFELINRKIKESQVSEQKNNESKASDARL